MNILLIGFKRSGKSYIGKALSYNLNKRFIDVDDVIVDIFFKKYKKNKTIYEIYEFLKEKDFRLLEKHAYESLKDIEDTIIATSGGGILDEKNFLFIKNKKVVFLKASKEILKKRIFKEEITIFKNIEYFEKQYLFRKNLYEKQADIIISSADLESSKGMKKIISDFKKGCFNQKD